MGSWQVSLEGGGGGVPITTRRLRSMSDEETVFHFVGYGPEAIAEFDLRIAASGFDVGEPAHRELDEALLAPMRPLTSVRFSGGVVDREGAPWPFAEVRRRGQIVFGDHILAGSAGPEGPGLDTAFYGGVVFGGYGHKILESIARITPRVVAAREPVVFHLSAPREASEAVFRGILEVLGVAPERVVFATGPLRVRRLIAAEPGLVLGETVKAAHVGFLQRIAAGIRPAEAIHEPLYLSRSKLDPKRRTGFGETELERRLGDQVRIVHPQTLSFRDQIAAVNSARRFLGLTGSQMHNLLFHAGGRRLDVVHLASGRIHPAYFQVDLLTGGDKWYINAADYDPLAYFGLLTPFKLDFPVIGEALRRAGFVEGAFDVSPVAGLDQAFRSAWLTTYARYQIVGRIGHCAPPERPAMAARVIAEFRRILDRAADQDAGIRGMAEDAVRSAFALHGAAIPAEETEALVLALLAP